MGSYFTTTDTETTEKCQVIQAKVIQHKEEVIQALLLRPQAAIQALLHQLQVAIQVQLHVRVGDIQVRHHPQEVTLVRLHLLVAIQVQLHVLLGDIQARHHNKEDIQVMVLHNNLVWTLRSSNGSTLSMLIDPVKLKQRNFKKP